MNHYNSQPDTRTKVWMDTTPTGRRMKFIYDDPDRPNISPYQAVTEAIKHGSLTEAGVYVAIARDGAPYRFIVDRDENPLKIRESSRDDDC